MNRKEEIELMIHGLYAELNEIKSEESDNANAALIGRCFRAKNSYSTDVSWWMYFAVTHTKDGVLHSFVFQDDLQGRYSIEPEYYCSPISFDDYEEISKDDFLSAWDAFTTKMNAEALRLIRP